MTHPTPLYNALTGVVIPLEMPDGRMVHVSVEEVIDCGYVKVVKGEGMLNKANNTRGDVIVSFDIKFPRKLNQFQKDLLDMALRLPIELTDETHIQRRLLATGLIFSSTPYTLHPTPYTLHLTPYSYALHPTPDARRLTPYTLHPEP